MREEAIHRAIWQHIETRLVPDAFACHVPNGGLRSKTEAAIFSGLGVVAGFPDLILIRGGRLSSAQADCHERLRAAGAIVGVAYGLDESLRWLESHGLLRGGASGGTRHVIRQRNHCRRPSGLEQAEEIPHA